MMQFWLSVIKSYIDAHADVTLQVWLFCYPAFGDHMQASRFSKHTSCWRRRARREEYSRGRRMRLYSISTLLALVYTLLLIAIVIVTVSSVYLLWLRCM